MTGAFCAHPSYDAQGHEATNDTHPDPFSGYGGQWGYYADWETSTTGGGSCLYLLGHRFYDPDTGRFITRDPANYNGGINLYAYTQNDPVSRADSRADPEGTTSKLIGFAQANVDAAFAISGMLGNQNGSWIENDVYANTPNDVSMAVSSGFCAVAKAAQHAICDKSGKRSCASLRTTDCNEYLKRASVNLNCALARIAADRICDIHDINHSGEVARAMELYSDCMEKYTKCLCGF